MNELERQRLIYFAARRAHLKLDHLVDPIKKVCTKGCDACCYQNVNVCSWEEAPILHYIESELDEQTRKRISGNVMLWFEFFNANTRAADRGSPLTEREMGEVERRFREKRAACPFLLDHACSIYPARPLVCRRHVVSGDPDLCRTDPHRNPVSDAMAAFSQVVATSFDPDIFAVFKKPLAYVVTEILGVKPTHKPIAARVYGNTTNLRGSILRGC